MAKRKKQEEGGGGGAPAWMATFSDLMNLLLCFFVLLFSMSSVDADKWEQVVASMSGAFSIFNQGSTTIGQGTLVGIGTSQLSNLDEYYNNLGESAEDKGDDHRDTQGTNDGKDDDENEGGKSQGEETGSKDDTDDDSASGQPGKTDQDDEKTGGKTIEEMVAHAGKAETMEMLDQISAMTDRYSIYDQLELSMDSQGKYVEITLGGSIMFDSGEATLKEECIPLLSKVGDILNVYSNHNIDIIGHTDNVPVKSSKYESNEMLSSARAISTARYLVDKRNIDINRISWTGRGEYEPVASNATALGRARNRRIEIRIYNSFISD